MAGGAYHDGEKLGKGTQRLPVISDDFICIYKDLTISLIKK